MSLSTKDFTPKRVKKSGKYYYLKHVTKGGPKAAMEFLEKELREDHVAIIHSIKSHNSEAYGIFVRK